MSKKIRKEPINIAPEIIGWLDENNNPKIIDKRSGKFLDPTNVDDKIIVYERQVKDWFLLPATNLVLYKNRNKGFIVLMICLSYLEGIEQYRKGENSNNKSCTFFVASMNRIYPNKYQNYQLEDFYVDARCGLFHNGMVKGRIIISYSFSESLKFDGGDIMVNPKKLLIDLKADFQNYIQELKSNQESQIKFNRMFSNS